MKIEYRKKDYKPTNEDWAVFQHLKDSLIKKIGRENLKDIRDATEKITRHSNSIIFTLRHYISITISNTKHEMTGYTPFHKFDDNPFQKIHYSKRLLTE